MTTPTNYTPDQVALMLRQQAAAQAAQAAQPPAQSPPQQPPTEQQPPAGGSFPGQQPQDELSRLREQVRLLEARPAMGSGQNLPVAPFDPMREQPFAPGMTEEQKRDAIDAWMGVNSARTLNDLGLVNQTTVA